MVSNVRWMLTQRARGRKGKLWREGIRIRQWHCISTWYGNFCLGTLFDMSGGCTSPSLLLLLLDRTVPSVQHAHTAALFPPLPAPQHLPAPPGQLIAPTSADQDPTHHIDDPHAQRQQPAPFLPDRQKYRLNVEFEEDARDGAFVDVVRLRGDGILIRDYSVGGCREHVRGGSGRGGGFGGGGSRVDCGDDGEVVLVFVKVGAGCCIGFVQRVEEGWVEGTEGQFVDYVGEIECCIPRQPRRQM